MKTYLQNNINVLSSRMDTFTALQDGSTTGDAELQDIRVGYDGTTYDTAGNAVRGQISELKGDLVDIERLSKYEYDNIPTKNKVIELYKINDNSFYNCTSIIHVKKGDRIVGKTYTDTDLITVLAETYDDSNDTYITNRLVHGVYCDTVTIDYTFDRDTYCIVCLRTGGYIYVYNVFSDTESILLDKVLCLCGDSFIPEWKSNSSDVVINNYTDKSQITGSLNGGKRVYIELTKYINSNRKCFLSFNIVSSKNCTLYFRYGKTYSLSNVIPKGFNVVNGINEISLELDIDDDNSWRYFGLGDSDFMGITLTLSNFSLRYADAQNIGFEYIRNLEYENSLQNIKYWGVGTEANESNVGVIKSAKQVISCGNSQADIRFIGFEDGSPIIENGHMYFSMTSRGNSRPSTIYKYYIGTETFEMIGAIQGSYNSNTYCPIAPYIFFNRLDGKWYVFTHLSVPHTLFYGSSIDDIRFGLKTIRLNQVDYANKLDGDEDSFVFYDSDINKWILTYCQESKRICKQIGDSLHSFSDPQIRQFNLHPELTNDSDCGVSYTKVGNVKYFISGENYNSDIGFYYVYSYDDMECLGVLNLDYKTGGYRGYGTIVPITDNDNTKYALFTYDRSRITDGTWDYGNLYIYESIEYNNGIEFPVNNYGIITQPTIQNNYNPIQLTFQRKASIRFVYDKYIELSSLSLNRDISLPNGNPYITYEKSDSVIYEQNSDVIRVFGIGEFSYIVGKLNEPLKLYSIYLKWKVEKLDTCL